MGHAPLFQYLLKRGIRIYERQDRMLHSKAGDRRPLVGDRLAISIHAAFA
jgi:hypothetical protein